jgi:homospermidine synthase
MNKKLLGGTIPNPHVINNHDDSFIGIDSVGCLLITEDKKSIWCGSVLSNDTDMYNSGTTIQVVAGLLSHIIYALKHPSEGILFPEKCNTKEILKVAKPLLGDYFLDFVDYKPVSLQYVDLVRTKKQFDDQY